MGKKPLPSPLSLKPPMKLNKTQKIVLASVGALALQFGALRTTYSFGHTDGFNEARVGYMKTPTSNGTLTVDNNGKPKFTPFPTEPHFDPTVAWNSKGNRDFVEDQIKNNMGSTQFGAWVKTRVASATCSPTKTPNLWHCSYRELGKDSNNVGNVEVNPKTGDWQAIWQ